MKTERIVDNPENHGWELVGGKWIWASGRNTGHITDGDLNGETTVWKDNQSAWVPNPRLVFNDGGYAHFTSPVKSDDRFHVSGGGGMTKTPNGGMNLYTENNAGQVVLDENGNVGIGTSDPWFVKENRTTLRVQGAEESVFALNTASDGNAGFYISSLNDGSVEFNQQSSGSLAFRTNNTERMRIDSNGKILFPQLSFDGGSIWRNVSGTGGIAFSSDNGPEITPLGNDAAQTDAQMNLGRSVYRFKNGYFSGTVNSNFVRMSSGLAIGTRDIIETLATLRASTLDETVDVRQALASACDKLIEKFEAMQDQVVTQDIQE